MQEVKRTSRQPLRKANGPVSVEEYFRDLSASMTRLPYPAIDGIIQVIMDAYESERTIFVFGNGGSAATASHIVCDLNKGTIAENRRKRLKVMAFTDNVPLITAWANDASYADVFAEQLKNFAQTGDVAFGISTSGNSPNILQALRVARRAGATTVGLAGFKGGQMKPLCDICAIIPSENVQMIEDIHHSIAHSVFTIVRQRISESSNVTTVARSGTLG
jgi:D-sedoheptulose 7-phosphate isomerase